MLCLEQTNTQLNLLIDAAISDLHEKQPCRDYLGASRLGLSCSRALQYEYMGITQDENMKLNGKTLRNFQIGHLFEELMAKWLIDAGLTLETTDTSGKQFGFKVAGGKIAGHIDGIIRAAPKELDISCPALWEAKSMNNKSWKETVKNGLSLAKPLYAAQIALYQAYMERDIPGISVNPCLFTAINKDTAEIYYELIIFDQELAQRASDKAVNIIKATKAGELLPRAFSNKDFYECKMCSYQNSCWQQL